MFTFPYRSNFTFFSKYFLLQIRHAWCGVRRVLAQGTVGSTTGNPSDMSSTLQLPVSSNIWTQSNFGFFPWQNIQNVRRRSESCTRVDWLTLAAFNVSFQLLRLHIIKLHRVLNDESERVCTKKTSLLLRYWLSTRLRRLGKTSGAKSRPCPSGDSNYNPIDSTTLSNVFFAL